LTDLERSVRAGTVGRPHGLDGSFHVADAVPELLEVGAEVYVAGVKQRITRRAGFDARPIVRFEGCDDRAGAQALGGQEIRLPRDGAPALGEDEWWAADLEGCFVRDGTVEVGVVTRLMQLPSCEVLEVARAGGRDALLVPLVRDAVRAVDVQHRAIEVDLRFLGED
jgi:16S rRNA processing protein RimM